MKNVLLKSFAVAIFLATAIVSAQDFQGKAVYQTKTKMVWPNI